MIQTTNGKVGTNGVAQKVGGQECRVAPQACRSKRQASVIRITTALAFARCTRAHGLPDFPDPLATPDQVRPTHKTRNNLRLGGNG